MQHIALLHHDVETLLPQGLAAEEGDGAGGPEVGRAESAGEVTCRFAP